MAFNFKNNNFIIILLLILVIASSMCYLMMEKNVEGFISGFDSNITSKFRSLGALKENRTFITLNNNNKYRLKDDNKSIFGTIHTQEISGSNFNFLPLENSQDYSFNSYFYISDISYQTFKSNQRNTFDFSSIQITETDISTSNMLLVIDPSGYFYDLSGNNKVLGFDLVLDNKYLIKNGRLVNNINNDNDNDIDTGVSGSNLTTSTGWSGDINFKDMFRGLNTGQLPTNMSLDMYAYMLQTNPGFTEQSYAMPFYSSFESAMNNPSNPLINPTNAMNPLQYNQSLFGPNVTPMMSQNMCKNSSADQSEKVREIAKEDSIDEDSSINSSIGSKNVLNNTFDKLNSAANTMLAQNTGDEGNKSNANGSNANGSNANGSNANGSNANGSNANNIGNVPPCPPCARCPESNFECKKVPAYEQGYENTALPRPVLTDFSTFGM